jgi:hypothetical protein
MKDFGRSSTGSEGKDDGDEAGFRSVAPEIVLGLVRTPLDSIAHLQSGRRDNTRPF